MTLLVNIDADQGERELQRGVNVRLFRRSEELRYSGRVHETLQKPFGRLDTARETDRLTVYHTGYSSKRLENKIRRNLALLNQEIRENGEKPRHAYYLANCYFVLQDYEKALYYAEKAMGAPVRFIGLENEAKKWAAISREKLKNKKRE